MNFEDLRRIWREHNVNPESETGDENMTIEQTVDVLRQTLQKTHRRIDRRDLLESGIAITMIFFFGCAFTQVPTVMSKSGCVVIIAGLLVIIYRLRRSRHTEDTTDSTLPLDQFCRIESERLAREARLLKTVPVWYSAPQPDRRQPDVLRRCWLKHYICHLPCRNIAVLLLDLSRQPQSGRSDD